MANILRIEILNWAKYNPKRDQKTYTWCRLQNDITTDPDLYGLAPEQKWAWICILAEASKKNTGTVDVNLSWLSDQTKVSEEKILEAIEILTQKPIIKVHDRGRPPATASESVTPALTTPTNERTNETNERTDGRANSPPPPSEPPETEEEKARAWAERMDLEEALDYFQKQFKLRTKSPIAAQLSPEDQSTLAKLYRFVNRDLAGLKSLINAYFFMAANPYYEKRGWPLELLEVDFNAIAAKAKVTGLSA